MAIEVLYSCAGCGLVDRKVKVRARNEGEDVVVWMEAARTAVGNDHLLSSLHCRSTVVDLKIPIPNEEKGIGYE